MIVELILELRAQGLKAGPLEALNLAKALALGLHGSTLDGLYDVARAVCVHREADLDAFDRAFAARFRGVTIDALDLTKALDAWLRDPATLRFLDAEERARLQSLDPLDVDELRRLLEERLSEQRGRHEGGSKWIGTGGTSPFGTGGFHPSGVRLGSGGARSALAVAEARRFRAYRSDVVLDVRSMEVALRRLKGLAREGPEEELDLEATIDETARQGGELEVVMRAPRRPNVKVLLLMDVGGSMDPHAHLVSRLFTAAKRASNLRHVESFYFHNAIYGRVFRDAGLRQSVRVTDLMNQCDRTWKLVVLGDALMHPGELLGGGWDRELQADGYGDVTAMGWFTNLERHFERAVWLNPEPEGYWNGTAELLARLFSMFELTVDGLTAAVRHLSRRAIS